MPVFIASLACLVVAVALLMRQLPAQNIAFIVASLAALELALEYWTKSRNIFAGAILWPGVIILSRFAGQGILKSWRRAPNYGLILLGLTSGEAALAQLLFVPATATMVAERFFATTACLLLLTPWFLQKRVTSFGGSE
jgi:hypothetical protein